MKDRFSSGAENYNRFRPSYPEALIAFISSKASTCGRAWDCGTGNGQLAVLLSNHFQQVFATDISEQQLSEAPKRANIQYTVEQAEHSSIADASLDVITVGQAIHWFNFDAFYKEVKRTLKPGGLIAVIGYGLIRADKETNTVIDRLYSTLLGNYWDPERRYIDERYQTIPFPFEELAVPSFKMSYAWTLQQFVGYLGTWSAVKLYEQQEKHDPLALIAPELAACWQKQDTKHVYFDVLFRLGKHSDGQRS